MKKINNNRGVAMVAVLTLMFVAAILSVALFTYSSEQLMQARRNQDEMQAKYLSRTGVEAALAAYNELNADYTDGAYTVDNPLVLKTTYTYLTKDSTGTLCYQTYDPITSSSASSIPAAEDIEGYYTVTVTYPVKELVDGTDIETVSFSCTATAGGQTTISTGASPTPSNTGGMTKTSEAYIAASTTGAENAGPGGLNWYDGNGTVASTGHTELQADKIKIDGTDYDLRIFKNSGVVNFESPDVNAGSSFNLDLNNNKQNKVGFAASMLYMNMPIDLQPNGNWSSTIQQVLVLSASDIVINEPVSLEIYYSLFGSTRGGTMVLTVPDSAAHTDPVLSVNSGKIYFNADVYLNARTLFNSTKITLFNKGEVYYFQAASGEHDGLSQIDLIKFWRDTKGDDNSSLGWLADLIDRAYSTNTTEKYIAADMRKLDTSNGFDTAADLEPPKAVNSSYLVWK